MAIPSELLGSYHAHKIDWCNILDVFMPGGTKVISAMFFEQWRKYNVTNVTQAAACVYVCSAPGRYFYFLITDNVTSLWYIYAMYIISYVYFVSWYFWRLRIAFIIIYLLSWYLPSIVSIYVTKKKPLSFVEILRCFSTMTKIKSS